MCFGETSRESLSSGLKSHWVCWAVVASPSPGAPLSMSSKLQQGARKETIVPTSSCH